MITNIDIYTRDKDVNYCPSIDKLDIKTDNLKKKEFIFKQKFTIIFFYIYEYLKNKNTCITNIFSINNNKNFKLINDNDIAIFFNKYNHLQPDKHKNLININKYYKKKLIIEMGYINRDKYHGLSWNNIGGKTDIMNHNCDNSRIKQLNINIVPIKINLNGYILICGQLPWDRQISYLNIPYNTWLNNLIKKIEKYTEKKIVFRYHPLYKKKIKEKIKRYNNPSFNISLPKNIIIDDNIDIKKSIQNSYIVIAYNSNMLLDAILLGRPTMCFDNTSMVYDLSLHSEKYIDKIIIPSKNYLDQTLNNISYSQWTIDEIKSGEALDHMFSLLKKKVQKKIPNYKKFIIVYSCNPEYRKYVENSIKSLLILYPDISIHVNFMDCSYEYINKMLKLSDNISYTKVDKFSNKSKKILAQYEDEKSYHRRSAKYANYRYELLENLLNNTNKHILYLDASTIINRKIDILFEYILNNDICLVKNNKEPNYLTQSFISNTFKKKFLDKTSNKIMSGLIGINNNKKSKYFITKCLDKINKYDKNYWMVDQYILNLCYNFYKSENIKILL